MRRLIWTPASAGVTRREGPVVQTKPICFGQARKTIPKAGGLEAATRHWRQVRQTKPILGRTTVQTNPIGGGAIAPNKANRPTAAWRSGYPTIPVFHHSIGLLRLPGPVVQTKPIGPGRAYKTNANRCGACCTNEANLARRRHRRRNASRRHYKRVAALPNKANIRRAGWGFGNGSRRILLSPLRPPASRAGCTNEPNWRGARG